MYMCVYAWHSVHVGIIVYVCVLCMRCKCVYVHVYMCVGVYDVWCGVCVCGVCICGVGLCAHLSVEVGRYLDEQECLVGIILQRFVFKVFFQRMRKDRREGRQRKKGAWSTI